jgi:alkaline phosphatase
MTIRSNKYCILLLVGLLSCAGATRADDLVRGMQESAIREHTAAWGHWGPDPGSYSSWMTHSNRLIPIYTFGIDLASVSGKNSAYRDADRLRRLYGFVPDDTLNADADYFDQTDVYRLQLAAAEAGKRYIVLFVFDGMDWTTTLAAATYKNGRVAYHEGRGTGLSFQDYRGAKSDFGYFVTSPNNSGTNVDVNRQKVKNPGGELHGGYSARIGGSAPWNKPTDVEYLIGKGSILRHAYPDSASTATALNTGTKTYNDAINVDPYGQQLETAARRLQAKGFAVGAVTSVPISHATPACTYANNVHRDDYQDITRDQLGLASIAHATPLPGLDVLLGAGWGEIREKDGNQGENFVPGNRYLTAADRQAIEVKNGGKYVVAERTAGKAGEEVLADAAGEAISQKRRLLGFFGAAGGHLPFATADGEYDPTNSVKQAAERYSQADLVENPKLPQMATIALDVLSSRSDHVWLMVEAGDVDWANHANNIDNSIGAVLMGDAAFQAVTQWIEKHVGWENAAVLLTADHGHYLMLDHPEALAGSSAKGH